MKPVIRALVPKKILRALGNLIYFFKKDPHVERFVEHNRKLWSGSARKKEGTIIFDVFPYAQSVIAVSYFVNALSEKLHASFRPFSSGGINNAELRSIYNSFGSGPEIITDNLDPNLLLEADRVSDNLFSTLKTKEDVFNLKIMGYEVGIDVYETYLRFCGKPTVFIDGSLKRVLRETTRLVFFWEGFFTSENVKAVVLSHACYNHLNVPAKIAFRKGLPVYIPYARGIYKLSRLFEIHSYFRDFRKMFSRLSPEEQNSARELAKSQLERRLSGEVGVDMPYSTKSAYTKPVGRERVLPENTKIKVLIASHCFYDNPYAFGDLLFIDFYEWISFLGRLAEETDYEWYLKMHPDPFPGTEDTMRELLSNYPRIRMLPKETSHLQLAEEGLNFVLTAYGSVGHEYPALGVQVINAGYNPRVAYGFNWCPNTVDEYRELLLNLDKCKLEINKEELYEFYYMYHYYIYADDLIFDNFRTAQRELGGSKGLSESKTYDYFLRSFTKEKHIETQRRLSEFIDSGAKFYFSKGPEPK